MIYDIQSFSGSSAGKESACNAGDPGLIPRSEVPLEKGMVSTPVFLPGEFHEQRGDQTSQS